MNKRALSLLLVFLLLPLPACASSAGKSAEALRDGVLSRFPQSFEASLTVSLGEEISEYRFSLRADGDGVFLTVLEPEALSGLSARVTGDDLSLSYDGILFAGETPEGLEISPLTLIPGALEALRNGILTASRFSGKELFADFTRYRGEDALTYRFTFHRDEGTVASVQVFHEDREIASILFFPAL